MPLQLTFKKIGSEIKSAIENRMTKLDQRLEKRNEDLEFFMSDKVKLRSYLVRSSELPWGAHVRGDKPAPLYTEKDISSEEKEETQQLCRRIFEIEQELNRLHLIKEHLLDEQEFELSYDDLVAYGFEASMFTE